MLDQAFEALTTYEWGADRNALNPIDEAILATEEKPAERKELIKTGAIEAFGEYFEEAADKDKIIRFVKEQQNSKSPKARKLAMEFLKRWGNS